jgi:hypothetical protein
MRLSSMPPAALLVLLGLRPASAQVGPPTTPPAEEAPQPPPPVELTDPRPNQGHFVALGFHGISAMAFDHDRGTRAPSFGQGFSLRLGESVTDWLNLSLAFGLGSTYGEKSDSLVLGRFGITSQWYLGQRWFVQAGLGATNAQGADPEDYGRNRGRYGDVYLTGLGYDFYLSDRKQSGGWVFTPIATAEVGPDSKFTTTALWIGIELSWWNGLSRDKLNLPTPKAYSR